MTIIVFGNFLVYLAIHTVNFYKGKEEIVIIQPSAAVLIK